ncbi:tryptophan synthase subunit alpha [Mariprofundus sp. EBB-1]|uniref:tryptophan synthase subunit alpha n=1 Tax=Mariprofundus sp. EBB-1 TaxID=2650971 RepID=UPI000EF1ED70|nr:tryptophan synthase subunit alpha [Mariprofundus sp. EBB-1]RLL53559.1 tryptophan synthase subunit alpha [Mariprofundus sp. EBB-1]
MSNPIARPSRLAAVFERCKQEGRSALVGYLTAGDPDVPTSEALLLALAEQSDILEIGMPFSDPMADGPVIQAASERALEAGTHIADVFALTKTVRDAHPDLGIVLMGYANVPYAMGFDIFSERAKAAGADGVLIVDIPAEEGNICDASLKQHGLDRIMLLSPTSTDERIKLACACASGFIYYVSLNGITGADMGDMQGIQDKVKHIKCISNDLPVCVGFGVKTPGQATQVAAFSDGVVVGSHFVGHIPQADNKADICGALSVSAASMRKAVGAIA